MPVSPVPAGHPVVSTCLAVKDAAKLADFLVRVFDAKVAMCHEDPAGTLRHADVRIGDSCLMLGEACEQFGAKTASLYVYVPDADATYARALEAGATPVMPVATQFYGDRHGGVADPFGNQWWIATHVEDVSPEELARRAAEHCKPQGS